MEGKRGGCGGKQDWSMNVWGKGAATLIFGHVHTNVPFLLSRELCALAGWNGGIDVGVTTDSGISTALIGRIARDATRLSHGRG